MTTLFYLTGSFKLKVQDVWVKSLRFIGRGFSIDKYYELKEYKFSLEYKSLFTYLSKNMMPSQFQEEMGIPKIVYEIGEHFPLVASLSGRFFDSTPKYSHDDLETIAPTTRRKSRSKRRFFSSSEGTSFSLSSPEPSMSPFSPSSPLPSPREIHRDDDMLSSVMKTYRTTRDHLVRMWLNINEKVTPRSKKMKEDSKVAFILSFFRLIRRNDISQIHSWKEQNQRRRFSLRVFHFPQILPTTWSFCLETKRVTSIEIWRITGNKSQKQASFTIALQEYGFTPFLCVPSKRVGTEKFDSLFMFLAMNTRLISQSVCWESFLFLLEGGRILGATTLHKHKTGFKHSCIALWNQESFTQSE